MASTRPKWKRPGRKACQTVFNLLIIFSVVFMSAMNIYSVKAANKVMVLFFLIKIFALVAIVTGGFYRMSQGKSKCAAQSW